MIAIMMWECSFQGGDGMEILQSVGFNVELDLFYLFLWVYESEFFVGIVFSEGEG